MNLYQSLGYLVLGSRLRRLSEAFLSEINRVYQNEGIDFDANWFPVFYLLSKNGSLSIKELSEQIEISHPAASQLITGLKNKNLVTSATCADDGRRQLVQLTASGEQLLAQVMPVWQAVTAAMEEMMANDTDCKEFLTVISSVERKLKSAGLSGMVRNKIRR